MEGRLINIGFGNTVVSHRVVAVVMPGSAPMKRLREKATQADRLIDATHGRKTRSIIVTDSNHIILSAVHADTLSLRLNGHGIAARQDSGKRTISAGEVFVITAPSGTGKTTLLKQLMAADPRLRFSISYTTRPPRPSEVDGRDYFFVSPEEFPRLRDPGALAEWVEQFGYAYGTSRQWVQEMVRARGDVVFDIESRGAKALKGEFPQGTFIFILPPSLGGTGAAPARPGRMDPEELARRLANGRAEVQEASWYDYLVINDDLATALSQLQAIVAAARCRTSQLWPHLAPPLFQTTTPDLL